MVDTAACGKRPDHAGATDSAGLTAAREYPVPVLAPTLPIGTQGAGDLKIVRDPVMAVRLQGHGSRRCRQSAEFLVVTVGGAPVRVQARDEQDLTAQIVADTGEKPLVEQKRSEAPTVEALAVELNANLLGVGREHIGPQFG